MNRKWVHEHINENIKLNNLETHALADLKKLGYQQPQFFSFCPKTCTVQNTTISSMNLLAAGYAPWQT